MINEDRRDWNRRAEMVNMLKDLGLLRTPYTPYLPYLSEEEEE